VPTGVNLELLHGVLYHSLLNKTSNLHFTALKFSGDKCFIYKQQIQGDFEGCADILTCDRTPQKVTIDPLMIIQMLIFFEKKGLKDFQKKFGCH
jgi:uncharacterized membrane protein